MAHQRHVKFLCDWSNLGLSSYCDWIHRKGIVSTALHFFTVLHATECFVFLSSVKAISDYNNCREIYIYMYIVYIIYTCIAGHFFSFFAVLKTYSWTDCVLL